NTGRREYRVSHPDASFVHTAVCRLYGNGHAACCPHGGQRKDDHLLRIVHNPDVRGWKGAGIQYCRNHIRSFRSEEHTSELQSRFDLVCRLLLEKKKETEDI